MASENFNAMNCYSNTYTVLALVWNNSYTWVSD